MNVSDDKPLPPEAFIIASLKELIVEQKTTNSQLKIVKDELETMRKGQEKSKVHLKYEVDLSTAHTDIEIADFVALGIEIDSIIVLPVPSALSLKLRGVPDDTIDLDRGHDLSLSGHIITRILATNVAGSGTAYIHVYGR